MYFYRKFIYYNQFYQTTFCIYIAKFIKLTIHFAFEVFFNYFSLVNYQNIKENSFKPAIFNTESCLQTYINRIICKFNEANLVNYALKAQSLQNFYQLFVQTLI